VTDAVRLFDQVATAADPAFSLAPHLEDVGAICRVVEGLPLAIELAAGHIRTLPPALLRTRLRARLRSPVGAARDMPERHRTIPMTIDWSLQLLGSDDRRFFARLGVFAGPVPLEVVEGVCADPSGRESSDALDTLTRLIDHSLVQRAVAPSGEPRFFLLELLREHARELLAAGEGDDVATRHAAYVAAFLDQLDDLRWHEAADRWIDLISDLLAEIRAAHAWAVHHRETGLAQRITAGMGTYWHREGHHEEGRVWVAHAMSSAPETDRLAGRLHLAAGFITWQLDQRVAREHWAAAVDLFRSLHDDRYLAYSLALTSLTYVGDDERHPYAVGLCEEALHLARRVAEAPLVAQALNIKGELLRVHGGQDELAEQAYAEGLRLARAVGDEAQASVNLANLAYLADHRGDYLEGRALGQEALRICWRLGRRMMAAWTVSELAGRELGLGRPEQGARFVGAADQALRILDASRHPGDYSEHERVVTGLRATLGDQQYERLLEEGAALALEEAVVLALSDPTDHQEQEPRLFP
jgi:hypothetical protein